MTRRNFYTYFESIIAADERKILLISIIFFSLKVKRVRTKKHKSVAKWTSAKPYHTTHHTSICISNSHENGTPSFPPHPHDFHVFNHKR